MFEWNAKALRSYWRFVDKDIVELDVRGELFNHMRSITNKLQTYNDLNA
jgi:hypothetical protein